MGWNNPPVPWREFERRLSWRQGERPGDSEGADGPDAGENESERDDLAVRPVTQLPSPRRQVATEKAVPWAELHCHSAYSFLDGASTPGELIAEAAECGLTAIAITDHDGMYGVPQFAQSAARFRQSEEGLGSNVATVFGAELSLDIPPLVTSATAAAQEPGAGPASGWRAGAHFDAEPSDNAAPPVETERAVRRRPLASVGLTAPALQVGTPRAGVPDPMGRHLLVLARDPEGYGRLCRVISAAHLAGGEKGRPV
ncbi:MAG: PHP domain-containing protein, partial [Streptosporangiaceae bacterium]